MEAVLLVIHLIVAVAIIVIVLLQPAEAGDFMGGGGGGGMSNMAAPRRAVDVLARLTTGLGACFFLTSLLLAIISGHREEPKSILDSMPSAIEKSETQGKTQEKPAEPEKPTAPISK